MKGLWTTANARFVIIMQLLLLQNIFNYALFLIVFYPYFLYPFFYFLFSHFSDLLISPLLFLPSDLLLLIGIATQIVFLLPNGLFKAPILTAIEYGSMKCLRHVLHCHRELKHFIEELESIKRMGLLI